MNVMCGRGSWIVGISLVSVEYLQERQPCRRIHNIISRKYYECKGLVQQAHWDLRNTIGPILLKNKIAPVLRFEFVVDYFVKGSDFEEHIFFQ